MRRMNSEGGIIDIVNEGIESGEIDIGGGGSGTQLYKHVVTFTANASEASYTLTGQLISTSNESFVGLDAGVLTKGYISGTVDISPIMEGEEPVWRLIAGITGGSEPVIWVNDQYGSWESGGLYFTQFSTDIISAI